MAGAELANGLHESTVAMEEGRRGGGESSEQDVAVSRPMFSVPFVQKVCFLASMMAALEFLIAILEVWLVHDRHRNLWFFLCLAKLEQEGFFFPEEKLSVGSIIQTEGERMEP